MHSFLEAALSYWHYRSCLKTLKNFSPGDVATAPRLTRSFSAGECDFEAGQSSGSFNEKQFFLPVN